MRAAFPGRKGRLGRMGEREPTFRDGARAVAPIRISVASIFPGSPARRLVES